MPLEMDGSTGGSADTVGDPVTIGIVTVSDRASDGVYEDQSGPAILQVGSNFRSHFVQPAISLCSTTQDELNC